MFIYPVNSCYLSRSAHFVSLVFVLKCFGLSIHDSLLKDMY